MVARNDTPLSQPRVTFSPHDREKAALRIEMALATGALSKGPENDELVEKFEAMAGRGAVTVASGGLALETALTSLRVVRDYARTPTILLPDICHWSDYTAARRAGWAVLWGPVDYFGHLDIPHVIRHRNVEAVMYVSVGGRLSNHLQSLEDWCRESEVELVADMSHAVGAHYRERKAALSFGTVSIASLFATKVVTGGEGGVITSADSQLMATITDMRDGGRSVNGWADDYGLDFGFNARMSELHAAVANIHFDSLPDRLAKRRLLAEQYDSELAGLDLVPWQGGSLYKYLIRVPDREAFYSRLEGVSPAAGVWDMPPWMQAGYFGARTSTGPAQPAMDWASSHVALPMHETLTMSQVAAAAQRVKAAL